MNKVYHSQISRTRILYINLCRIFIVLNLRDLIKESDMMSLTPSSMKEWDEFNHEINGTNFTAPQKMIISQSYLRYLIGNRKEGGKRERLEKFIDVIDATEELTEDERNRRISVI